MPRPILPAMQSALDYGGKSKAQIAREQGCSTQTLYTWLDGRAEVPQNKRARLARAIGGDIDWQAYAQEFEAARNAAQELDQEQPKAKAAGTAPRPRPAPSQADPLAGGWGDQPKPAPAPQKPRPAAPKPLPRVKTPATPPKSDPPQPSSSGGWLSRFLVDDGEDPFA